MDYHIIVLLWNAAWCQTVKWSFVSTVYTMCSLWHSSILSTTSEETSRCVTMVCCRLMPHLHLATSCVWAASYGISESVTKSKLNNLIVENVKKPSYFIYTPTLFICWVSCIVKGKAPLILHIGPRLTMKNMLVWSWTEVSSSDLCSCTIMALIRRPSSNTQCPLVRQWRSRWWADASVCQSCPLTDLKLTF